MLAKSPAKLLVQPVPVSDLLYSHLLKHIRRRRIALPQSVRELAVNPSVFFFVLNRQRQYFAFRQILEFLLHLRPSFSPSPAVCDAEESHTLPAQVISRTTLCFSSNSAVLSSKYQSA